VEDVEVAKLDLFSDEVDVELNMFGALVVDGVGGHVHRRDVVTVCDGSLREVAVEFAKELAQPNALSRHVRHSPALGLRA